MQRYKRPLIEDGDLQYNPFVGSLSIGVTARRDPDVLVKGVDGYLPREYYTDRESSVRVYVGGDRRKSLAGISPSASKLFIWVQQELDSGKDYFWLNKVRYMEEAEVSYNTYKNAVGELQDLLILAKTKYRDVFWINPHFLFRGDRVGKYRDVEGVVVVVKDDRGRE